LGSKGSKVEKASLCAEFLLLSVEPKRKSSRVPRVSGKARELRRADRRELGSANRGPSRRKLVLGAQPARLHSVGVSGNGIAVVSTAGGPTCGSGTPRSTRIWMPPRNRSRYRETSAACSALVCVGNSSGAKRYSVTKVPIGLTGSLLFALRHPLIGRVFRDGALARAGGDGAGELERVDEKLAYFRRQLRGATGELWTSRHVRECSAIRVCQFLPHF